jgi:phage shock protein PspC (stress-responsive transcriptional regulator)
MSFKQVLHRLHRSTSDAVFGGVCAGFAEATETPAWVWRAGFLFTTLFFGFGVGLYLILWLVMPTALR